MLDNFPKSMHDRALLEFLETDLANIKSAIKRARQNAKLRQHNTGRRSMLRTYIKKVVNAIQAGDKAQAELAFKKAQPIIDAAANSGIIHKNKAARHKSRMNAGIKKLANG
jgi:small subunit ribosomal protein S20